MRHSMRLFALILVILMIGQPAGHPSASQPVQQADNPRLVVFESFLDLG